MNTTPQFIKASDLDDCELEQGILSGRLKCWRTDADGEQWLRAVDFPEIHGVPGSEAARQRGSDDES